MATFVAATVPVEKAGDTSPLLEAAQGIGVAPDKSTEDRPAGGASEPAVGSYESFMSSFGRSLR